MIADRNKELALVALRNLINDIAEDKIIVLDVGMVTSDPKAVDPYFTVVPEQVLTLRTRVNDVKMREMRAIEDARKALVIARAKHSCNRLLQEKPTKVGDVVSFKCGCGVCVTVTGQEIACS